MPLYEYACSECRHSFEVLQRIGDDGEGLSCPRCRADSVQRQLSTFAAHGGSGSSQEAAGCGEPACGAGAGFT
ncbi:MAG: zinc ribbon domain-containing protein [Acidobacteriota bacterium]